MNEDMPGLDTAMVVHHFTLRPECKPVKHKFRRMKMDVQLKIKEEVKKQLNAGFLTVARYPEWVANRVPVPKSGTAVQLPQTVGSGHSSQPVVTTKENSIPEKHDLFPRTEYRHWYNRRCEFYERHLVICNLH